MIMMISSPALVLSPSRPLQTTYLPAMVQTSLALRATGATKPVQSNVQARHRSAEKESMTKKLLDNVQTRGQLREKQREMPKKKNEQLWTTRPAGLLLFFSQHHTSNV